MNKPLFLILKKEYFDAIERGEKTTEYRELSDYWLNRLAGKPFKEVIFQNGYSPKSPRIHAEITEIRMDSITHKFFGIDQVDVIAIDIRNAKRVA